MDTSNVLNPNYFTQQKLGRRCCGGRKSQLVARRHWYRNAAYHRHVPLCIKQQHTGDTKWRISSRRGALAACLHIAVLCTPTRDAHPVESMRFKEDLKMEDRHHGVGDKLMIFNSCPGEYLGPVLAYLGTPNSSSSSLGVLGCLVFGLLYLKEKQENTSNASALEDVQEHIKRAEAQLGTNTRSYIKFKLEESQLGFVSERDISLRDAVKCQLCTIKSSNAEKEQQLTSNKHALETLKQQAVSLVASLDELKRCCSSNTRQMDQRRIVIQGLEVVVKGQHMDLQFKLDTVDELKVVTEEQELACNNLIEQNAVLENSLNLMNENVLMLQTELKNLSCSFVLSKNTQGYLSNELNIVTERNLMLELHLNKLLRCLQHEEASFKELVVEVKEQLVSSENKADVCVSKLLIEQDVCNIELERVGHLTAERDTFNKNLREKKGILENVRKAICSDLERRKRIEVKLYEVCQKVQQEKARNATLQSAFKGDTILPELLEVSVQLESQLTAEKKLSGRLREEMRGFHEALRSARQELLELKDNILSTSSCQAHLKDDLTKLIESQQAHSQALKKQKRATTYAKRQLTQTRKILGQEKQVLEALENELQCARKHIEDSKLRIVSCYNQLETSSNTMAQVADSF